MLIACDNKGCLQQTNALLNAETLEVICTDCKRPIRNIAGTMKRVLLSSGQIIRDEKRRAFTMGCKNCNANRQVVLNERNETVCSVCAEAINVHPAMRQAILEAGVKLVNQTSTKEEAPAKPKTKTTKKTKRKTP